MRDSPARKMAFCGLDRGLCLTVMLLGYLVPFATYVVPAVSGALLMPIIYEYGRNTGAVEFVAVSVLSLLLVSDYEIVFMFIFVFGSYTVVKMSIDKMKNKKLGILIKFLYVNIALVIAYGILLFIFPVAAIVNEFSEYSYAFILLLAAMFNLTFFLYDRILEKLLVIYVGRFRKVLFKNGGR